MSKTIVLKREDCYCSLITFYENVAKKLSFKVTDETEFDCRKICVTKPVQEAIWEYYREQEDIIDDSDIAALWLFCGPKTNLEDNGNLYAVSLEFGFVVPRQINNGYYEKGGFIFMDYFRATCDKQLGICLRMLYAEGIQGIVEVIKNNKGKIEFHVFIEEQDKFERLRERYEIMIS